jgi:hypothetical protein
MVSLVVGYAGLALMVVGALQTRTNTGLGLTLVGAAIALVVLSTFVHGRGREGKGPDTSSR